MRIYVAASWRNEHQPRVVHRLRGWGHEVYDFRNPSEGDNGFHWSEINPNWQQWTLYQYRDGLKHELADTGFAKDKAALDWAEAGVLVLPSGCSSHLECGYLIGQGKPCCIYVIDKIEPELMYKLAAGLVFGIDMLKAWAERTANA